MKRKLYEIIYKSDEQPERLIINKDFTSDINWKLDDKEFTEVMKIIYD